MGNSDVYLLTSLMEEFSFFTLTSEYTYYNRGVLDYFEVNLLYLLPVLFLLLFLIEEGKSEDDSGGKK